MPIYDGTPGDDSLSGSPADDQINGLGGNDSLRGHEGNDVIDGGDGHDFMRGNEGNDIILGSTGDDYLDGGAGDDLLDGGAAWDRVTYAPSGTGPVTVDLRIQGVSQNTGQGNDTLIGIEHLSGTAYNDNLTGTDGDNWLWGGSDGLGNDGNDIISALGGNDLVEVGHGDHFLDGGTGTDTLSVFGNGSDISGGVTLSLALQGAAQATGQGSMTLSGFENVSGSAHNDVLSGDGNANLLAGDEGSDMLSGGGGADTLYGDGRVTVDTHNTGGSGPTTFYQDIASIDPAFVGGNDVLEGGAGDDLIYGGGGTDTASYANATGAVSVFLSNFGNGSSSGADGEDSLFSIENLTGSAFDDDLFGNNSNNVLTGGDGHDFMRGQGGNDTMLGGNGDDYLAGGEGDDTLDGGAGVDRASYASGAIAGVTVDLNIVGVAQDTGRGLDILTGIEQVTGTEFADTLTGDGNDNWLWGLNGDDHIFAGGGNDTVQVVVGNHVADGGSGIDTVSLYDNGTGEAAAGVTVSLLLQGVAQNTGLGMKTLTGFENLSGTDYNDTLTGDGNVNTLAGSYGNDMLAGGGGNDSLYGDGQFATTHTTGGGGGAIILYPDIGAALGGVDGDDVLEGGDGNDQLFGGGGIDTASYASAGAAVSVNLGTLIGTASGGAGNDQLHDIENVTGSAYDDNIRGSAVDNVLSGGLGHDFMRGFGGNDTMLGGGGDDYLDGGLGDDLFDGGAGYDRISFAVNAASGVTVDLTIVGTQNTGHGNDTITNVEHISGTKFSDIIIGDGGANWLWGGSDNSGVTGDDSISGNGGNDLIWVGAGNHLLSGGTGTDTLGVGNDADVTSAGVTLSLALQGAAQATGQGSWNLSGFENLSGSGYDDRLTGDGAANLLAGGLGNDTLSGGGGNDTLLGDGLVTLDNHNGGSGPIVVVNDFQLLDPATLVSGNDTLDGGDGNDTINGGGGSDTASYASATGAVTVTLNNAGNGVSSGAAGNDTLISIENVTGSAFNDFINGNDAANVLTGGDGHDFMRANGGNDTMLGGNGDDYLAGGEGDDAMDGGAGVDRASYAIGAIAGVTVNLNIVGAQNTGRGMDTLTGIENVTGTDFADTLTGDGNDNWLWGLNGNDVISAGGGNDLAQVVLGNTVADGGTGTDTFSLNDNGTMEAAAGVTVSLLLQGGAQNTGLGSKTLTGFENLSGSDYNDTLTGDGNANTLAGGLGNDVLSGGAGNDLLYGDGLFTTAHPNVGGGGAITLYPDLGATFGDVDGNDILDGGDGNDTINGGGGSDTASYASATGAVFVSLNNGGNGSSSGAAGNDTLISIENITGSAFNDTIDGNDAANILTGGDGHDFLRAEGGNDTVLGGNGDDYLAGGEGDDALDGGAGVDRASYAVGAVAGVTVNLNIVGAQNTGRGMDTLTSIEQVTGTAFADTLTGDGNDNWLWGLNGNDVISAGGGNDMVQVVLGNTVANGGAGNDTFSVSDNGTGEAAAGVTVSLALQGAAQATGIGSKTLSGFENLSGSDYNDSLTGDGGANVLAGSLGNDNLSGGDGADRLYGDGQYNASHQGGGGGTIVLFADIALEFGEVAGNDTLDGGKGNDILVGGGGDDMLTGGAGDDMFVVGTGSGHDHVTDMAKKDVIAVVGVAGIEDFGDLTIVNDASGKNAVVSWGTGDSITIDGMKANKVTASMFAFTDPTAFAAPAAASFDAHHSSASGPHMLVTPDMW